MPEQLKPLELVNRYRFVLAAFGLQYVRTEMYKPGKPLDTQPIENEYQVEHTDRGTPNMHSGYSTGELLRPGKTGQQPISALGTPIWSDIILSKEEDAEVDGIQLTNSIIAVSQPKRIVKTAVEGRDGTVKEYISLDDYKVVLRGAIARSFKSEYPIDEMRRFLEVLKHNAALNVTSEYLLQFGIYRLVVEEFDFAQESGRQNMQKFEIKCVSDDPIILKQAI